MFIISSASNLYSIIIVFTQLNEIMKVNNIKNTAYDESDQKIYYSGVAVW